jgi:hypothetical protein
MTISLYFAFFAIVLPLLFVACINEQLDDCPPPGGNVYVKIHWDNLVPGDSAPTSGMHIQLFPTRGPALGYPLRTNGGLLRLTQGTTFNSVCFDYEGMEYLRFRNMNDAPLFAACNEPVYDDHYTRVEVGHEEPLVHEPFPYTFYTTRNTPMFTVPERGETDTLHCYPKNVLHEFTYLVHGVEGIENVLSSRGAISGIAGAYRMMTGQLAEESSTVLFRRSRALNNGCFPDEFRWNTADTLQRIPVAKYGSIPVSPKWFKPGWMHPETGWKGDWVIGAFSVFGITAPCNPCNLVNQLTVECFSHANYHYYASWGYWKGDWEDTVTRQIMGSMGYWPGCPENAAKGSIEAQTAWRKHNGGFDIILSNEGRLVIPPDVGLKAPVSGWDGVEVPLY